VLKALHHLEIARERTPASAQVRNDYGYVLLMVGDYEDAAYELRTAMELGDGKGPVRQNLAVAYLLTDNWGGLEWMKKQYDLSSEERAYAERLAEQFGR
jgi:Flp pilus assembly protein TadD